MSTSITVAAGVTDILRPEHKKYEKALNDAENVMNEALNVMNEPEFETMEGWKLKNKNKIDKVYVKKFPIGKVFTIRTILDIPRDKFFFEHWNNFAKVAYMNKNTSYAEKVAVLTPHVEIIHYAMKNSGLIQGRDFVTTRIYRNIDDCIIEAGRSYESDEVERYKKKVRGNLLLGGCRLRIHPEDSEKTIADYIVCLEFNSIELTKSMVESVLSKMILQNAQYVREVIEKLKNEKINQSTK